MVVRALGNSAASFRDRFNRTGNRASNPPPGPFSASGGTTTAAGITPGNGYRYHVFTSPGTFTVSGSPGNIEYLVVAGGGSGGYDRSGGGGAGGMRSNSPSMPAPRRGSAYTANVGTYTVTVGSGGAGQTGYPPPTFDGSNSEFYPPSATYPGVNFIRVVGGGSGSATGNATGGGSGGGATSAGPGAPAANGGAGGPNHPPATDPNHPASQGFPGGRWPSGGTGPINAAGGGGSGGAGGAGGPDSSPGGNGGPGLANPDFAAPLISPEIPSPVRTAWTSAVGPTGLYAGGGGGGGHQPEGGFPGQASGGSGGPGGGGAGGTGPAGPGGNGVNFTGSGGGGGNNLPQGPGGSGGTGIVIIRYLVP